MRGSVKCGPFDVPFRPPTASALFQCFVFFFFSSWPVAINGMASFSSLEALAWSAEGGAQAKSAAPRARAEVHEGRVKRQHSKPFAMYKGWRGDAVSFPWVGLTAKFV